jgi:hypothetical protein
MKTVIRAFITLCIISLTTARLSSNRFVKEEEESKTAADKNLPLKDFPTLQYALHHSDILSCCILPLLGVRTVRPLQNW